MEIDSEQCFDHISRRMFESRGLAPVDAFLLASKVKYGEYAHSYVSQKHDQSRQYHAWMDRVMEACAKLDLLPQHPNPSLEELSELTGHSELIRTMQKEEDRIKELISIAKSERSKGFLVCKSCKRDDCVQIDQKQTRSSDEPMTLFALCESCGFQWTVNG
jgi:DNA-directed RNA polymerase subunit M/transcription elongation factor TFIIS